MQRFLFVNTVVNASFHVESFQNQENTLLCLSQKSWRVAIKVTQCLNRRCHIKNTSIQALISGIGWIHTCVKLSVYRVCLSKPFDIDFATWSSAGSLRPHSDTVKKIPGLRPGHVFETYYIVSFGKRNGSNFDVKVFTIILWIQVSPQKKAVLL